MDPSQLPGMDGSQGFGGRMPIPYGLGGGPRGFGHDGGDYSSLEWAIFALLVVILVLVSILVYGYFTRPKRRQGRPGGPSSWGPPPFARGRPDPLAILSARYASGDLERDDYLRMRDDLQAGSPAPEAPPPS